MVLALIVPTLVACGSESNDEGGPEVEQELPLGCSRTQFDGDENCVGIPEPGKGIQLHAGPSNYDDELEVAPFLIQPGQEKVECYTMQAPNTETYPYFEQQNRMRPGSHHMIIRVVDDSAPLGWGPCGNVLLAKGGIPGSQTQVRDIPGVKIAPENKGLGRTLPPNAKVQFEFHFVNNQRGASKPLLREAWVNLLYKDPATITEPLRGVAMIGGLGIHVPPRSEQTVYHSCNVTGDARVFDLFGHFHAHTERFSAWRTRDGQRELIYESYNWAEPADLVYDTVNKNPAPDAEANSDGGWSGTLEFKAGDQIEWECNVKNKLDTPLNFANEAYTAEMCILFGGYVGASNIGMSCFQGVKVRE
jgi:hypothetical protein